MTYAVSPRGDANLGLWGTGELKSSSDWMDILQGKTLISQGSPVMTLPADSGTPSLAFGIAEGGDFVLATSDLGDLSALRDALVIAGAQDAMLVTAQSSADLGYLQTFYEYQGRTFYTLPPLRALRPALLGSSLSVLLGSSDAFVFTQKSTQNRARFVRSFKELKKKKASQ
jgi:hypothetical protein